MRLMQIRELMLPTVLALVLAIATTSLAFGQTSPINEQSANSIKLPPQIMLLGPVNRNLLIESDKVEKASNERYTQIPLATDVSHAVRPGFQVDSRLVPIEVNPDNFLLATNSCYGLTDRDNRFGLRALRGSLYSIEAQDKIKLVRGRMLLIAERCPVRIEAGEANITVAAGSSTIVETTTSGLTRVYSLVAYTKEHPAVKAEVSGSHTILDLNPGQELLVAKVGLPVEEVEPTDGIERRPLERGAAIQMPRNVKLFEFSLAQMAQFDVLINCQGHALPASTKVAKRQQDLLENVVGEAAAQSGFESKITNAQSQMIAGTNVNQGQAPAKFVNSRTNDPAYKTLIAEKGCLVICANDAKASMNDRGSVTLNEGTLLVRSPKAIRINAEEHQILAGKGVVAVVQLKEGSLKVASLSDPDKGRLRVITGKKVASISAGREILFTRQAPTLADVFDIHKLGHRYVSAKKHSPDSDLWVTTGEVSLKDMLAYHPLTVALRTKGVSSTEKKTASQILKTAAIMQVVRKDAVAFQTGEPEDEKNTSGRIAARCNSCLY